MIKDYKYELEIESDSESEYPPEKSYMQLKEKVNTIDSHETKKEKYGSNQSRGINDNPSYLNHQNQNAL